MASRSRSPLKKRHSKSKSPKKSYKSKTSRKSKSPKKSKSKSRSKSRSVGKSVKNGEKVKFYDLLAKKAFTTSEYKMVTKIVNGKNGKRKVTYYVTTNPTPRKDGSSFENWKILSNAKA
jgi:hypothetical protein